MATKVWTQEQKEAAQEAFAMRLVGKPEPRNVLAFVTEEAIYLQCELTEAVELLNAYIHNIGVDGPRVVAFLQRNTPQEKKSGI